MKLMPLLAKRFCPDPLCKHEWHTAYPLGCACPKCDGPVEEPDLWPFVCARGHGATHGGECEVCRG